MSSQIAAKLPISCIRRSGRARNHQWRCSLPSPQRHYVDPADPADRPHRPLDPDQQRPELDGELGRKIVEVVVVPWLEEEDDREAGRLRERSQSPVLVRPEVGVVAAAAPRALRAGLAVPRRLLGDGRLERPDPQLAVERERLPFGDGRQPQRSGCAGVQLLRRLS